MVCRDCLVLDHPDPPRGNCQIVSAKDGIAKLRTTYKENLNNHRKQVDDMRDMFNNENIVLTSEEHLLMKKTQDLQTQLKETDACRNTIKKQQSLVVLKLTKLEEISAKVNQTEVAVNEATNTRDLQIVEKLKGETATAIKGFMTDEGLDCHKRSTYLIRNSQQLLSVVRTNDEVCAKVKVLGQEKWTYLAFRDDRLLLYSLKNGEPPPKNKIVSYNLVRSLVPDNSPSIFLEVGWNNQIQGRVFVQLFGNTPRSRQAVLLSSGEKGPTYRNTVFYHYRSDAFNVLYGGDFEKGDGSGGRAIVDGITDGGVYRHEVVTGLMGGFPTRESHRLGGFEFCLSTVHKNFGYDDHAFGIVTKGLDVLRQAANVKPITNASVIDCGLVIPI